MGLTCSRIEEDDLLMTPEDGGGGGGLVTTSASSSFPGYEDDKKRYSSNNSKKSNKRKIKKDNRYYSSSSFSSKKSPSYLDPFMNKIAKNSMEYTCGIVDPDNNENINENNDNCSRENLNEGREGGEDGSTTTNNNELQQQKNDDKLTIPWQDQHHLLFHKQQQQSKSKSSKSKTSSTTTPASSASAAAVQAQGIEETFVHYPTRLLVRRRHVKHNEEGMSGTHVFAVRYPRNKPLPQEQLRDYTTTYNYNPATNTSAASSCCRDDEDDNDEQLQQLQQQEQRPESALSHKKAVTSTTTAYKPRITVPDGKDLLIQQKEQNVDALFQRSTMLAQPEYKILDWVIVSDEHSVYIADIGLSAADCDRLVQITEQACRGQYAAYTYAKQTLGCREFPTVAHACQNVAHTVVHAIYEFSKNDKLYLDDREPHMVKYDITKKERQKLDMHTDKSEFTFLIALSNGSGLDYDGGGTYFECLDATVHIQRGHALIFPGRLRHCGQRISSGLRFLLVGFLVDKNQQAAQQNNTNSGGGGGGGVGSATAKSSSSPIGKDSSVLPAPIINIP